MLAGKYWQADELEYKLNVVSSYTRSNTDFGIASTGSLLVSWAPDSSTVSTGIILEIGSFQSGAGPIYDTQHIYQLRIPDLGIDTGHTYEYAGWQASVTSKVVFNNVRIYWDSSWIYHLYYDSIDFYVEASIVESFPAGTISGLYTAPTGIPVIGTPCTIGGNTGTDIALLIEFGGCGISSDTLVENTVSGGSRFKKNGTWYSPSCNLDILPESDPSGCSISLGRTNLSAVNTYSMSADSYFHEYCNQVYEGTRDCYQCPDGSIAGVPVTYDVWTVDKGHEKRAGTVSAMPNLSKGIVRLNSDYSLLVKRGGIPRTRKVASSTCCKSYYDPDTCTAPDLDCTNTKVITETVFDKSQPHNFILRNATSTYEDVFTIPSYAPYSFLSDKWRIQDVITSIVSPGACGIPTDSPSCCYDSERSIEYKIISGVFPDTDTRGHTYGMDNYLDHDDSLFRFYNTVGNPHWLMRPLFPPDSNPLYWRALGSKQNSDDYWIPLGEQWQFYKPLSSTADGLAGQKRRNHLISEALNQQGSGFIKFFVDDVRSSWIGLSRMQLDEPNPSSSLVLNSSSAGGWSFTNATAVFGVGGISLTPSSVNVVAKFTLGNWNDFPRLYPELAKSIELPAFDANVASVNVYLVNQQGKKVLLASSAGTHNRPTGNDENYAGSYGQSFLIESGGDSIPGGVSSGTYSDPKLAFACELTKARTATYLQYELTLTAAVSTVLSYPTFHLSGSDGTWISETRQTHVLLFPDGPAVRYGQMNFYNAIGESVQYPPTFREMGTVMSVLDYLIWKRVVLQAEVYDNVLDTEIASLYDETEGQERKHLAIGTYCFPRTLSGKTCGQYVLVNSLAELPPIAWFPVFKRDSTTLAEDTTTLEQKVYSFVQETRRYVSPEDKTDLVTGGTSWTTPSAITVSGFKIEEHRHIVDNNEGATFDGYRDYGGANEQAFFKASPWHGYFCSLLPGVEADHTKPAYDVSDAMRHYRAFVSGGSILFGKSSNVIPLTWSDVDTGIAADTIAIAVDKRNQLDTVYLIYSDGGTVYYVKTDSEGGSFTVAVSLGTGEDVAIEVGRHGARYMYYRDGTDIKGQVLDAQDNVIVPEFTAVTGVDALGMDVSEFTGPQGQWMMGIIYVTGGVITTKTSPDGVVFS